MPCLCHIRHQTVMTYTKHTHLTSLAHSQHIPAMCHLLIGWSIYTNFLFTLYHPKYPHFIYPKYPNYLQALYQIRTFPFTSHNVASSPLFSLSFNVPLPFQAKFSGFSPWKEVRYSIFILWSFQSRESTNSIPNVQIWTSLWAWIQKFKSEIPPKMKDGSPNFFL